MALQVCLQQHLLSLNAHTINAAPRRCCSSTGASVGFNYAPAPQLRGSRARICRRAATSFSDWDYSGFTSTSERNTVSGAYSDPRAAPAGASRQYTRQEGPPDGPSTSYDSLDGAQEPDPLSEIARTALEAVAGCLAFLVGRLSDAALSLLPQRVRRKAVENSVKGALALLGLALLQSVLSLVLTVGTLALAVYAAHQVFGVRLPFLPMSGVADGIGQEGGTFSSAGQTDPRFAGSDSYATYGAYGPAQPQQGFNFGPTGAAASGAQGYRPPRQAGYAGWQGQAPYPPRPGAGAPRAGQQWTPPGSRQQGPGPTIDVFYDSQ